MLFVVFDLGDDRWALEASRVVEVLPLVRLKRMQGAPAGVAGVMNWRGAFTPVLDIAEMALGRASAQQLSTRILVVRARNADGRERPIGLMAEHATGALRLDPEAFAEPGLDDPHAPWLGPIAQTPQGLVQRIDLDRLLPAPVRELLFAEAA